MAKITTVFSDVGGVLLTNGWDRASRHKLVEKFDLALGEFGDRHELVSTAFETGKLDMDHYLDRTVFFKPRTFTRDAVKEFMFAESQPFPDSLAFIARLAEANKYLMTTLNNESTELNQYRIDKFGLRKYFTAFFSSCYLGVKKPDEAIYVLALDLVQRPPEECVFIDDRALNLECAKWHGMNTIQFKNVNQLENDLRALGVEI
ncbi:MAG TPA: HAD-IA family hydrolase [Terriglobia bacterium]|nr:HAD-IA family hydrolase [Terriglobia bacterium]